MRLLTLALAALLTLPAYAQRGFDNSSGEYMRSTSAPSGLDDHTMTMSCWARVDTSFAYDAIMSVGYGSGPSDWSAISSAELLGNEGARVSTSTTTDGADTQDTSTSSTNTALWSLFLGRWDNSSSRTISRFKESNKTSALSGTSSTSMSSPSNSFDAVSIATEADSTRATWLDGDVAFCAIWSVSEYSGPYGTNYALALTMGMSPTLIDPNNLVAYYELDEDGATDAGIDLYGNDLTTTGTVSPITDGPPPVFYPTGGN